MQHLFCFEKWLLAFDVYTKEVQDHIHRMRLRLRFPPYMTHFAGALKFLEDSFLHAGLKDDIHARYVVKDGVLQPRHESLKIGFVEFDHYILFDGQRVAFPAYHIPFPTVNANETRSDPDT